MREYKRHRPDEQDRIVQSDAQQQKMLDLAGRHATLLRKKWGQIAPSPLAKQKQIPDRDS
jgi:hypothetical protein